MNPANDEIRLLLVVGIAAMLLLFVSFLLIFIFTQRKKIQYQQSLHDLQQTQQNQLIEAAVRSEENERVRIAEELHDDVGALLSSAKLHFQSVRLKADDEVNDSLLKKSNEILNEAIKKIRNISHSLHSYILQEFGLNEAIHHFIVNYIQSAGITVSIRLDSNYVTKTPQKDISIYRIIQELLNNILKHSAASQIIISSVSSGNLLSIKISHDGKGLTQTAFEDLRYKKDGLGLKNIQNRINLLNGDITFTTENSLYHINLFIPANN